MSRDSTPGPDANASPPLENLPERLSTDDDAAAVKGGALPPIVTTPLPTGPVPIPYPILTSRPAR